MIPFWILGVFILISGLVTLQWGGVYIKCCKARNGFLMRVLTEQRTFQEYAERGVMRFSGMAPLPGQAQEKKGGWGVL